MTTSSSDPAVIRNAAARIQLIVFDVDGVLTDGKLIYGSDGTELKAFHVQDGSAIKRLQRGGYTVAIITGRESPMVTRRAAELGIAHLYQGREAKPAALAELLTATGFAPEQLMCVGDDLADLDLFHTPGLALGVAVANAHPRLLAAADYVTQLSGGNGVARELASLLLGDAEYRAPD